MDNKQLIANILSLLDKRALRKKEKRFVVEGERLVSEAISLLDYVIYSQDLPILKTLKTKGIPMIKFSKKDFARITSVETPQGILGVARMPEFSGAQHSCLLISCGIQDPGNLGTIIRAADAAGVDKILVSRDTVDRYNQKVIRSTMGSIFHVPVEEMEDVAQAIQKLKQDGIKIIATQAAGKVNFWDNNYKSSCAIILGNEASGIPENILGLADQVVSIPILGKAESLNVAMSATIMLYEVLRQRKSNGKS